MPDLHVVAAGSLLELAVEEIPSLGVGRLTSLYMYPLTFREYLAAMGEEALSHIVDGADPDHPLDEPFHRRLVEHVKGYQLVGGMPAVVNAYAQKRDLAACFRIQDDLITSFQDDFAKYKKRAPVARLAEVFRSVVLQTSWNSTVPDAARARWIELALKTRRSQVNGWLRVRPGRVPAAVDLV